MRVGHLLRNEKTCHGIEPHQPLLAAVRLMMQHRVGALVVLDAGALVGIITERDVLGAVDRHTEDLREAGRLRVADLMSTRLVVCSSDTGVDQAMALMLHNETGQRVRHLPVVDEGHLRGVISIGDVIQALLTETEFEAKLLRNYIKNWPEPD